MAVDHDQVRVRARVVRYDSNARPGALADRLDVARAARRQHAEKRFFSCRRFAPRGTRGAVVSPGAGRVGLVVARERGEARVQAEQARLRGARKRGGERVVAGHAHGHVAVGRDASGDQRVRGFKREERGAVWRGSEELDGGARLRAEASRDVAVATENRVGDALGAQHVERGHGRGVAGVRSGVVALPREKRFFGRRKVVKKV